MRRITIFLSIIALTIALADPALAGRKGVPGRRVGGGTRIAAPHLDQATNPKMQPNTVAFTSDSNSQLALS